MGQSLPTPPQHSAHHNACFIFILKLSNLFGHKKRKITAENIAQG
jgi:hypothetical protein